MAGSTARTGTTVLLLLSAAIVAGAFLVSDGLYNIDEHLYVMSGESFALNRSFILPDLTQTYSPDQIEQMKVHLYAGPNGLTVQYPMGMTLLGALVIPVMGVRGLILANAVAVAAAILFTRGIGRVLYRDETIAMTGALLFGLATFALEYAFGIWPHGITVGLVTGAVYFALRGLLAEGAGAFGYAALAGICVGMGFLFRFDAILILPMIGAAIILVGAAPVRMILGGIIGLGPFIAATSLANAYRFGTYNPLSYGHDDGGTDITRHIMAAGVLAGILIALIVARQLRLNERYPRALEIGALLIAVATALLPEAREIWLRIADGAYNLLIDLRGSSDTREAVVRMPEGTTSFWGLGKKALGQSMPWIGIAVAVFAMRWNAEDRRGHLVLICGAVLWMLPFFMLDWHGGMSNNTRYFLPVVPLIAVLCAYVWITLFDGDRIPALSYLAFLIVGGGPVLIWWLYAPSGLHGAQQILPLYYLAGMAVLSLTAYLPAALFNRVKPLSQRGFMACLGAAVALGVLLDNAATQGRRELYKQVVREAAEAEAAQTGTGQPGIAEPAPSGGATGTDN